MPLRAKRRPFLGRPDYYYIGYTGWESQTVSNLYYTVYYKLLTVSLSHPVCMYTRARVSFLMHKFPTLFSALIGRRKGGREGHSYISKHFCGHELWNIFQAARHNENLRHSTALVSDDTFG